MENIHGAINLCYRDADSVDGTQIVKSRVEHSNAISRIITLATNSTICATQEAYLFKARFRSEEQIAPRIHTHTRKPFNIPVAGGEPITLALKYGNRATGSAYRRLDKRCDARSIGPPTDRGASALARASLLHSASLGPPSRTQSARNHLLCTWLEADCYPGILPFLRPAVHIARRSRVPPSPGRTWSLRMRAEYSASDRGIQHSSNYEVN